jgi:hypothetical protein
MTKNTVTEIQFLVCPRDASIKEISLAPQTLQALNQAAKTLKEISHGRYALVLTRGYIAWGKWRRLRGQLAKGIFGLLYWSDRAAATCLFGHNGHNDGFSVDVLPYDLAADKIIAWLSWRNIFISRRKALELIETNKATIHLLDQAMKSANFVAHVDPREQLQMHYRLSVVAEPAPMIAVSQKLNSFFLQMHRLH